MLPLNGWICDGTRPSGMTRSRASASSISTLARVVSKWLLLGTTCPGSSRLWNRMRSAARPWWVGMMWRNPVRSWTTSRKRKKERLPAYDSSPCMIAPHCAADIAPVPESVRRSMSTSSARRRKTL